MSSDILQIVAISGATPILLRTVTAHLFTPWFGKRLTDIGSQLSHVPEAERSPIENRVRAARVRLMFLYCFVFSAFFYAYEAWRTPGHYTLDWRFAVICVMGCFNAFAVYALWQAMAISLSRQALFTMGDDLWPMALGFLFLGEAQVITPLLAFGLILSIGAAFAYSIFDARSKAETEKEKSDRASGRRSIFFWIAVYSVIWGTGHFIGRYLALTSLPRPVFLLGWYGSSFLSASFLLVGLVGKLRPQDPPVTRRDRGMSVGLSVFVWASLLLEYVAHERLELAISQPASLVSEMVFPALIGLYVFKEIKQLSRRTAIIFIVASLGTVFMALGYGKDTYSRVATWAQQMSPLHSGILVFALVFTLASLVRWVKRLPAHAA